MSRGPGRIQRELLALMDANPDGAWSTAELCELVYRGVNRVEKKHRVAVARALQSMRLPDDWDVTWLSARGNELCLFNRYSDEAAIRMAFLEWRAGPVSWRSSYHQEEWRVGYSPNVETAVRHAANRRKWRDASDVERIDKEIDFLRQERSLLAIGATHGNREACTERLRECAKEIAELEKRKADVNVS